MIKTFRDTDGTIVRNWTLQEPRARFAKCFAKRQSEGPQRITKRASEPIVVIAFEDERAFRDNVSPVEFFRSPYWQERYQFGTGEIPDPEN